jgi:hypothetical protein
VSDVESCVQKEFVQTFCVARLPSFPIPCCYATAISSLSISPFNAIETVFSIALLGSIPSALLVLYGRSRAGAAAGAGLSTLGGVRAETAEQRALSSVVIAETR